MTEDNLLNSLNNTAFTTGAGANCFFQGFIHTLCYTQESNVMDCMVQFPGSERLIAVFNREVPGLGGTNINDLVMLAKAMHPLERELIFGPLMRITLNELNLKDSDGKPLTLEKDSIIYPPHAVAFVHAFGFSYDEYNHINDSESMPEELKKDRIGDYYRVRYSLENSAATLVLRLKSCHFEVGGLNPDEVAFHQSKIIPKIFYGDPRRPELPGARYYEEPSPNSGCAVKNSHVDFNTAVSMTLSALRLREGKHQQIMIAAHDIPTPQSNFNFSKFKETYQSELDSEGSDIEESSKSKGPIV